VDSLEVPYSEEEDLILLATTSRWPPALHFLQAPTFVSPGMNFENFALIHIINTKKQTDVQMKNNIDVQIMIMNKINEYEFNDHFVFYR